MNINVFLANKQTVMAIQDQAWAGGQSTNPNTAWLNWKVNLMCYNGGKKDI